MKRSLCYISNAVKLLDKKQLNQLFNFSKNNNSLKGITGYLIYSEGTFMQILEGKTEKINTLFNKIKIDTRHNQITTLLDCDIENSVFNDFNTAQIAPIADPQVVIVNRFLNQQQPSKYVNTLKAILRPFLAPQFAVN